MLFRHAHLLPFQDFVFFSQRSDLFLLLAHDGVLLVQALLVFFHSSLLVF